jgi:hypothetical protein
MNSTPERQCAALQTEPPDDEYLTSLKSAEMTLPVDFGTQTTFTSTVNTVTQMAPYNETVTGPPLTTVIPHSQLQNNELQPQNDGTRCQAGPQHSHSIPSTLSRSSCHCNATVDNGNSTCFCHP